MDILSNKNVKSRKNHSCNYCGIEIAKGEIYNRQVSVYDGIYTWKSHLRCQEIASKLNMFDYCDEGVTDQDFTDFINDAYCDISDEELTFKDRLKTVCDFHLNITS